MSSHVPVTFPRNSLGSKFWGVGGERLENSDYRDVLTCSKSVVCPLNRTSNLNPLPGYCTYRFRLQLGKEDGVLN